MCYPTETPTPTPFAKNRDVLGIGFPTWVQLDPRIQNPDLTMFRPSEGPFLSQSTQQCIFGPDFPLSVPHQSSQSIDAQFQRARRTTGIAICSRLGPLYNYIAKKYSQAYLF